MNMWNAAAIAVATGLLPCADMCLRGSPERRLVGFEMASLLLVIAMVLFTVGSGRVIYIDVPMTLAVMSFGGGLVFARFLEKHL